MSQQNPTNQPNIRMIAKDSYRDSYANSVQVKMSVWDFQLVFGTMSQESADEVAITNFQGIYLSPQQAKALMSLLGNNLAQYEQTFGKVALEPQNQGQQGPVVLPVPAPGGPVN